MMMFCGKRKSLMIPSIDLSLQDGVSIDETAFLARAVNILSEAVEMADLKFPDGAELSLVLAGDKTLKALNNQWRQKDKPTNVLSFPGDDIAVGEAAGMMLGDIVISLETTAREASLENKTFEDHLSHLVVHGFLHLFGYDHETDEEANQMESLETRILNELGIEDPYDANPYENETL
jgi:probable rRNA maturation factor